MRRRAFITLLGGAAATWPLAARAQQGERVRRIGVLTAGPRPDDQDAQANIAAFLEGLKQLGWVDGRNVRIDYSWGLGQADTIRRQAAELAALAPDVILAHGASTGRSRRERSGRARCGASAEYFTGPRSDISSRIVGEAP
jgi:putative tryptophan/tyrosine transport system substrate-binding protein